MPPPADKWDELVDQASQAGYFDYTDFSLIDEAKTLAKEQQTLYMPRHDHDIDEITLRATSADGEDLAEGGVTEWLWRKAPFLSARRIKISSMVQEIKGDSHYWVKVNGVKYTMFSQKDFGNAFFWARVPANTFAMLNKLLEAAGSAERVYTPRGTFGGNDTSVVFLTPELYTMINKSPLVPEGDKLYSVEEALGVLP